MIQLMRATDASRVPAIKCNRCGGLIVFDITLNDRDAIEIDIHNIDAMRKRAELQGWTHAPAGMAHAIVPESDDEGKAYPRLVAKIFPIEDLCGACAQATNDKPPADA